MKIIIAPQKFKGNLTALEVARAMEDGVKDIAPMAEVVVFPVADGGDGTLETLMWHQTATIHSCVVTGPLGDPVEANWGFLAAQNTAVVEMAQASGVSLLDPDRRNPMVATSYGTGEVIRAVLDYGARRLLIGLGGTATNDGGAGLAQALGVKLLDWKGNQLCKGGLDLARLSYIDMNDIDKRLQEVEIIVAADVTNPLCGEMGTSMIYSFQKGADCDMAMELEQALSHYATIIEGQIGISVRDELHMGAGGGSAAGLFAFFNGRLERGVDVILDSIGFDQALAGASLVITGEGCLDRSTLFHKAPIGVALRAKKYGIPTIAVTGSLAAGYEGVFDYGIESVMPLMGDGLSLAEAMNGAYELISEATHTILKSWFSRPS